MAYPYGNETPLTAGVNALLDKIGGGSGAYPYGNETPLTAGFNAVIAAISGSSPSPEPTPTYIDGDSASY